jgi:hypothetical protein
MIIKVILATVFLIVAICLFKAKLPKPLGVFAVVTAALLVASIWALFALWMWLVWAAVAVIVVLLRFKKVATITVLAAIVLTVISISLSGSGVLPLVAGQNSPAVSSSPSSTPQTWKMETGDYANSRWFPDGIQEIKDAKTDEAAAAAAAVWLERVKTDPVLLAGTAQYFLNKDVDSAILVDENSWATAEAVELVAELQLALAQADINAAAAPMKGHNSGVYNGQVVTSLKAGISGDRKAIKIVLADGRVIWVMARCGNPVVLGEPSLPKGPTDDNPSPTLPATTKPTPTLAPKKPGDGPAQQGNLPTQQIPNPMTAAPIHAQPTKPATPPATYVPPATPKPTTKPASSLKPAATTSTRPTATPVVVDPVQTHGPVSSPSW